MRALRWKMRRSAKQMQESSNLAGSHGMPNELRVVECASEAPILFS